MSADKIEIYKDEKLLELTHRMVMLNKEEAEILFSDVKVTNKGRLPENIARDMITVYEETNEYLKIHYPENIVATSWIDTNQFSANLLKEHVSDSDLSI
jgi:hypothetical protein